MISTSEEGNFTIPENIPLKLMDSTTCTGKYFQKILVINEN